MSSPDKTALKNQYVFVILRNFNIDSELFVISGDLKAFVLKSEF